MSVDSEMSISPKSKTIRSRSRSPIPSRKPSSSSDDMFIKTPQAKKDQVQIRLGGETEDTKGYYIPQVGEILLDTQKGCRYKINSVKGKGVFSCVVEVSNLDNNEKSAIKVLRNNDVMRKSGEKEIKILTKLNQSDPNDRRNIIRIQDFFNYQGHLCIKFENLAMNLRDLLNRFGATTGLSLEAVKSFARQGFVSLYHLKSQKIIHADSNF